MNKRTIRKSITAFIVVTIVTYFILLGLLGNEGFFHARSVKDTLDLLKEREATLLMEIELLEYQKNHMSSEDGLKDAAFRFGYQLEGEKVFYFVNDGEPEQVPPKETPHTPEKKQSFTGFSKPLIALMALAFSSLFTVLWYIGIKRRDSNR